jgi:hypothetical protein
MTEDQTLVWLWLFISYLCLMLWIAYTELRAVRPDPMTHMPTHRMSRPFWTPHGWLEDGQDVTVLEFRRDTALVQWWDGGACRYRDAWVSREAVGDYLEFRTPTLDNADKVKESS